ncbi:hypothetical protein ACFLQ1_00255 [Candidatus Auribacterota bacterium]
MSDNSAEEKLLNLIKGKEKQKAAAAKQPAETISLEPEEKVDIAWEDLLEPLSLFKLQSYSLSLVHKMLLGVVIILSLYTLVTFYKYFFSEEKNALNKLFSPAAKEKIKKSTFALPAFSKYQIIGKKKLFKLYEKPRVISRTGPKRPEITIQNKLTTIKLVGIIWDEGRPQAIIEDRKSKNTHYVYEGDIINDIRIENIEPGRVILRFGDEESELNI